MISAIAKEDQRLWIAVGFSFLLHAALLAVKFAPPTNQTSKPLSSGLEIILVNARHDKAPVNADALAQANLSGGGNTELGRARSPLPNLQQSVDGNHIETQRRKIAELEQQQERMLSQLSTLSKERIKVAEKSIKKSVDVSTKPETMDTVALARREAEIAKQVSDYNKRPIKSQLTPSTREVSYAVYYATLQKQIERTGTRYFPQKEGKKIYGDLIVYIPVYQDGSIYEKEGGPRIEKTSGNRMLDHAALAIVRRAAPFGSFPKGALGDGKTHVWEIITRFRFTRDEVLETSAAGG
ncbi:TonB C terminal [Oxalobacteraceae bacterium]